MSAPFNVLFSCAGRRNYLIDYFQKALGASGEVLAADASPHAASMIEAKGRGIILPPFTSPGYFDRLLERCRGNNVRMLLSLNDFELPLLAREAARFREAGVIPVVSDPEIVDLCFDKWRTFEYFMALGVPTPETCLGLTAAKAALRDGRLRFPLVIKPRWGTASLGVAIVADEDDLEAAYAWTMRKILSLSVGRIGGQTPNEKLLVQQALEGQEYGFDIINDLAGAHRAVIVKRKLSMRPGGAIAAAVEPHEGVAALARTVGQALKLRGLTDGDAFVTADGTFLLELNPRFGGGYPFSHAAGANVPAALLAWAQGRQARPEWLTARPGTVSAMCDRLVSN